MKTGRGRNVSLTWEQEEIRNRFSSEDQSDVIQAYLASEKAQGSKLETIESMAESEDSSMPVTPTKPHARPNSGARSKARVTPTKPSPARLKKQTGSPARPPPNSARGPHFRPARAASAATTRSNSASGHGGGGHSRLNRKSRDHPGAARAQSRDSRASSASSRISSEGGAESHRRTIEEQSRKTLVARRREEEASRRSSAAGQKSGRSPSKGPRSPPINPAKTSPPTRRV